MEDVTSVSNAQSESDLKQEAEPTADVPPVPIKTYQWEEVRRSRARGDYPWTHLTKDPFDDPDPIMDTKVEEPSPPCEVTIIKMDVDVGDDDLLLKKSALVESPEIVKECEDSAVVQQSEDIEADKENVAPTVEEVHHYEETKVPLKDDSSSAGPSKVVTTLERNVRAQSEEAPTKRKRKLSIDSSYSRVSKYSLSKLGAVKRKIKEAKDKIKLPKFAFSKSEPKLDKKSKEVVSVETEKPTLTSIKPGSTSKTPVYIHIPLKPPEGESDEFSYLEFEQCSDEHKPVIKKEPSPIAEEEALDTPTDLPPSKAVHLIILTAPSDDEILDDVPIPETPSESDAVDPKKIDELKTFAKVVVDKISPETKRKQIIIPVSKEDDGVEILDFTEMKPVEEVKDVKVVELPPPVVEVTTKPGKKVKKPPKAKKEKKTKPDTKVEDEEDGLMSAIMETAHYDEPQHPIEVRLKKVVSFKRRSREEEDKSVAADYEEIQAPKPVVVKKPIVEPDQQIKEDIVLKEQLKTRGGEAEIERKAGDKEIDHEYEPINPPGTQSTERPVEISTIPDQQQQQQSSVIIPTTPPSTPSTGKRLDKSPIIKKSSKPSVSASEPTTPVEISSESLERLASKLAEMDLERTGIRSERQSRTGSPAAEVRPESHAQKLQAALKGHADKFKTRVQSIKRPNIQMPKRPSMKIKKPSISLPSTPNISMPKVPSFSMPKKPSFSMPKTPSFSMPKPSFSMPKKPSLSLPKRPSLTLPKRPHISMPKRPKFNIPKPTMTMPRIPDRVRNINFASLTLRKRRPHRIPTSTESTVGSARKRLFDFSTYPRFLRRKPRADEFFDDSVVATTSSERTAATRSQAAEDSRKSEAASIRIPLHSPESIDKDELPVEELAANNGFQREDSVERRMREASERSAYDHEEEHDAYMRENQQIHQANRWTHGSFHQAPTVENLEIEQDQDLKEPEPEPEEIIADDKLLHTHQPGVLEEINSDEFFLRQKGISQDNIEMGAYLRSEIREAFKMPTDQAALDQLEREAAYFDQNYDRKSLPDTPKRRTIQKPSRRKKTPHVSAEEMQQRPQEYPAQPERPSRHQHRLGRDYSSFDSEDHNAQLAYNILMDEKYHAYENEQMAGVEQPNISISSGLYENEHRYYDYGTPEAPRRRKERTSDMSLTGSDHDRLMTGARTGHTSILQDNDLSLDIESAEISEAPTATVSPVVPPVRPARNRSRTRSRSRATSHRDELGFDFEPIAKEELFSSEMQPLPVEEPSCVRTRCDSMGYAVIEKHHKSYGNDSALPPPAPRRQKKKFATEPRKKKKDVAESPERPSRNYSTLVSPQRPARKSSISNMTDEEKRDVDDIDISQYIEIALEDQDHTETRHLQSGAVVEKMKGRPLPAPPRPPRSSRKSTPHPDADVEPEQEARPLQGEPKPKFRYERDFDQQETITHGTLLVQPFTHEDGSEPQELFSRSTERIVTVRREYEDDSEIPEEFHQFRPPSASAGEHFITMPQIIERIIERPVAITPDFSSEIELLRAHKLQVGDLDVDNLRVNELQASKITVAEIDSSSIQTQDISSRGGNLVVGGIELPSSFLQQLMDTIKFANEQKVIESKAEPEQSSAKMNTMTIVEEVKRCMEEVTVTTPEMPELVKKVDEICDIIKKQEEQKRMDVEQVREIVDDVVQHALRINMPIMQAHFSEEVPRTSRWLETISRADVESPVDEILREAAAEAQRISDEAGYDDGGGEDPVPGQKKTSIESRLVVLKTVTPASSSIHDRLHSGCDDDDMRDGAEEQQGQPQRPPRHHQPQLSPTQEQQLRVAEFGTPTDSGRCSPKSPETTSQSLSVRTLQPVPDPLQNTMVVPPSQQHDENAEVCPPRPPQPAEWPEYLYRHFHDYPVDDDDLPPPPPPHLPMPHQSSTSPRQQMSPTRRRRHHHSHHHHYVAKQVVPASSSDETPPTSRAMSPRSARSTRSPPEFSIPELTGQLSRACFNVVERSIKRVLAHFTDVVGDGKQDVHVIVVILLVLLAGLLLLGWGHGSGSDVHHHHWEYFNPPKDI